MKLRVLLLQLFIFGLVTPLSCFAQSAAIALSSGNGNPGGKVTLNLTLSDTSSDLPASVQWTFAYSTSDFSAATVTAGPQATAGGKSVSCNSNAGSMTCLVSGQNSNTISSGVVATIALTVSGSTKSASSAVQLVNPFAADGAGWSLPTSATSGLVTIGQSAGLNGFTCNSTSVVSLAGFSCTVSLFGSSPNRGRDSYSRRITCRCHNALIITVPQGGTSGTFSATAGTVTTPTPVQLTASYGGVNEGFGVTITPLTQTAPKLSSVSVSPSSISSGQSATGTVSLSGAAASAAVISLSSSKSTVASVPSSVTIAKGSTSATFTMTAGTVSTSTSAIVTASYSGVSATATLTVNPAATISSSIAYVQGAYATPQSPQTSVSVTLASAQTSGDLNVVVVGWNDSASAVGTVTDKSGNTYTRAIGSTVQSGAASQSIYYAKNIKSAAAGANSVIVTFTSPATAPDIRVLEYKGADLNSPVDVTAASQGSSAISSTSVTTTNASDLIFGANLVQTLTSGPGSGFTKRLLTSPDGDIAEDRMVTAVGSYSATAPLSTGKWIMQMVAFRTPASMTLIHCLRRYLQTSPQRRAALK